MPQVTQISPNDPPTLRSTNKFKLLFIILFKLTILLILITLIAVMLVTLILQAILFLLNTHPSKPEFFITRAHVDRLNLTRPSTLHSSINLTIRSYNPNGYEIYYDEIFVHASYKGQKITTQVQIPPFYQDDHEKINSKCAYLVGHEQIVGYDQVESDLRAGKLELNFEISGKLRWSRGSLKSRFNVNCVAIMPFGTSYVKGPFNCSTTL
ncbi:hypothetical protein CASFOL_004257 [Castilleja foliolosa]|uniref:Late embryogenesis abundant protein LEA-2 subgroup domain-containing protein n=1 Tax=Castilleja foliolosa TaxID=1961234 RepID=A0ABD3E9W6_9LAMI